MGLLQEGPVSDRDRSFQGGGEEESQRSDLSLPPRTGVSSIQSARARERTLAAGIEAQPELQRRGRCSQSLATNPRLTKRRPEAAFCLFLALRISAVARTYHGINRVAPLRYLHVDCDSRRRSQQPSVQSSHLIERLLSEGRTALVCRCGHDKCARSLFVFHEPNSAVAALKWQVGFLLER